MTDERGEVVSVDALCEAVWGEQLPHSARKTLQSYVTRLRSGLEAAEPLARNDLDRVADLMTRAPTRLRPWAQWWSLDLDATRLDALAALDDTAAVEAEAAPFLGAKMFTDAVATRAVGAVRRDRKLLLKAAEMFTGMDLPAQVAQTLHLADQIGR